jgi:arylsulfatase A-like enzyme
VHYQDPHGPYTPPVSFARPFEPTHASASELPLGRTNKGKGQVPAYQVVGGERDPVSYRARYAGEIRYFDRSLGELFAWLEANDWYEDALIVFTADHGESLGEHDYWFCHGENVYRETMRVPLVIRFPKGVASPEAPRTGDFRRVSTLVSHLDLWPTLLEALGLEAPANRGSSLFARALPADRVAVQTLASANEAALWSAISDGRRRLIVEGKLPPRLFDARTDLEEAHDLANAEPDRVRELAARLREFLNGSPGGVIPGTPMHVDPANEAALKRLGYTEGHDGE